MFQEIFQWLEQAGSFILTQYPFFISTNFLLFLILLILIFKMHDKATASKLINSPPVPWKLPLMGNLHQIGSLPHQSFHSLAQKHGSLMLLHFGQVPTLVVSSASAAKEIMKVHDLILSNRPVSRICKKILYEKDIAFAPYGENWRRARKICVEQLLSPKRVQLFRSVMEEEVALMVEKINQQISSSSSSTSLVNLSEMLYLLTCNIISRITMGRKHVRNEGQWRETLVAILHEFDCLIGIFDIGNFIPSLAWMNCFSGLNARVEKYFRMQDRFLDDMIEDHVEKRKIKKMGGTACGHDQISTKAQEEEEEEDFVDVLLNMQEENMLNLHLGKDNIKALVLDMITAGTGTSSAAPEWAMAELIKNEEIMKEVQEEVRRITNGKSMVTKDDIEKMELLKLVIKETLRLHPPGPLLLPHESTKDMKIQGYDVPAKTTVLINAWSVGRDPLSWEEPDKFNPKRFMNISVDFRGKDFRFIPFGAGRRACPGYTFAITTIELVLANLLNRFNWTMPYGMNGKDLGMAESPALTVGRKDSLLLDVFPNCCT